MFLTIIQTLPWFSHFLVCQFSRHIPGPTVGHFSFFKFFSASLHIPGQTVFVYHFPRFSVFLPRSRSSSLNFPYLSFFTLSCHIPCCKESVSHFPGFSVFLAIFHVLQCEFLIFLACQYSWHIEGPTVCVSHCPRLSVFSPKSRSYCVFFLFHGFHSFSTYSRSNSMRFSFFMLSVFLAIFHVLTCEFLIFLVCQFSRHIPGPTVFVYLFLHVFFFSFLSIFQVLPWFSHFPHLLVFSTYSRSYSVCFSFSMFFQVSHHFPSPTVGISHFSSFSVLLSLFQVI